MNAPYQAPPPNIAGMLDELVAAGRSMPAACTELRHLIRTRAVKLQDCNQPMQTDDALIERAVSWIDAFRRNAQLAPWNEYLRDEVFADRAQFEAVAGIKHTQEEPAASIEPETAKRLPPKRGAALEAIKACFPDGVPDVTAIPNGPFCIQIFAWLKVHRPKIEMDNITVLRTAGRR
jgi:hypothetical protein